MTPLVSKRIRETRGRDADGAVSQPSGGVDLLVEINGGCGATCNGEGLSEGTILNVDYRQGIVARSEFSQGRVIYLGEINPIILKGWITTDGGNG